MAIEAGQQLLHYRLIEKIGEGGMGVVWRAEDTTLDREVAIKILPDLFTQDPDRLARFNREAKLLASLNHPNIATLHGLQQAGEVRFLVMELVEGEELSQRMERGPLPVEEALPIALQLAEALESAHERGVIHRDLKPANVKLTAEGNVKVLDFGLAKALKPAEGQSDSSMSPTLTSAGTQAGLILGTAAYMSPEQAKGKTVDRRADIWAFGVILHEMLTGRLLFAGGSVSEVLAAVLMSDPDPNQLPANTPPRIRRLIERCLRRDPVSRLRDIGDARIALEEALAGHEWTMAAPPPAETARVPVVQAALWIAAGLVLGAGSVWLWSGSGAGPSEETISLAIPLPPTLRVIDHPPPRLTPDGKTAVFHATDVNPDIDDHDVRIYVRPLDVDELIEVQGSKGADATSALSPDGRWLVYVSPIAEDSTRRQLMRVPLDQSAPPQKIIDWPDEAGQMILWPKPDRILLFRTSDGALLPVSVSDGTLGAPVEIQSDTPPLDFEATDSLENGRYVLGHLASFDTSEYQQNAVLVDSESGTLKQLVDHASHPVLAPSGHLLFTRGDTLLAAPFDLSRLEITGGAQTVASGIWASGAWTGGIVDVSPGGHLLYGGGEVQGPTRELVIVTRDGVVTPWSDEKLEYNEVSVSPDGRRVGVQVDNIGQGDALLQIRVSDYDRPQFVTVVSIPGRDCTAPSWSTDSKILAYQCLGDDVREIYVTTEKLAAQPDPVFSVQTPTELRLVGFLAGDAHLLAWVSQEDGTGEFVSIPLDSGDAPQSSGKRLALEEKRLEPRALTPDGRWLIYSASQGGGRREFFVRRVESATSLGPRIPVFANAEGVVWGKTVHGGTYELFFERDSRLHSVEFVTEPTPRFSEAVAHDADFYRLGSAGADALPDGRLMMIRAPDTERGAAELRLVLHWTRELARRFE